MVKVYPFSCFDIVSGTQKISPRLASRSFVRRVRGQIEGPAVEVEVGRLDGNGMIPFDQLEQSDSALGVRGDT